MDWSLPGSSIHGSFPSQEYWNGLPFPPPGDFPDPHVSNWINYISFQIYLSFYIISVTKCNGTPLQYSCLENPMDGGAWWAAVHGVAKSRTRLSDFTLTFHFHALEKEMNGNPLQCSCLENPRDGEPGGLPSMGLHRVGHDWSDAATTANGMMISF